MARIKTYTVEMIGLTTFDDPDGFDVNLSNDLLIEMANVDDENESSTEQQRDSTL